MDKDLPASAEDAGSIPCPRRFHMLPATKAQVPQGLELKCSRERKPQLMRPCAAATEACKQLEWPLPAAEKTRAQQQRPKKVLKKE